MASTTVATISAADLAKRMAAERPPQLIDCREPSEWAIGRIEGAQLVPMRETKDRIGEFDRNRETVVYCHHGVRSRKVAEFLLSQGFTHVASLEGGIDAWSLTVDPSVPRY